jgi:hypothetical protein
MKELANSVTPFANAATQLAILVTALANAATAFANAMTELASWVTARGIPKTPDLDAVT